MEIEGDAQILRKRGEEGRERLAVGLDCFGNLHQEWPETVAEPFEGVQKGPQRTRHRPAGAQLVSDAVRRLERELETGRHRRCP